MKMRRFAIALLALASSAPIATAQQTATKTEPQDARQAIEAIAKEYDEYFIKQDAEGIASLYEQTGVEVLPGPTLRGQAAIREFYQGLFKAGFNGHTGAIHEVQPIGANMAWAVGEWGITGTGPNGAKLQNGGKLGGVYEQNGGDWKIVMMTVNVKPPPEPATGSSTQ